MSRTHPRRRRGFGVFFLAFLLVLLVGLYGAYWLYMRAQLERGIDDWIAAERAGGRTVAFSERHPIAGFPFRFALRIDDPVYGDPRAGQRWEGERLDLVMQPWNWQHLIVRAPGENRVETPEGRFDITLGPRSAGSLSWGQEGLNRLSISLDEAVAASGGSRLANGRGIEFHLRAAPDAPAHLQLSAGWDSLDLAAPVRGAEFLGTDLAASRLILELRDALPVLEAGGDLADWAQAGGRLNVAQLLLNWGPAQLGGRADLGVDGTGRLDGRVDLRIDEGEPLKRAILDSDLPEDDKREIAQYIEAIAAASQSGSFLPLTIRSGELRYLGQTVGEVPPIRLAP